MTATGEQELPIDLDGGLRLRRSTSDDAEPLAEFNRWIHRDEGVTAPDDTVGEWTRELLSGSHPTFAPDDFTIVEEKSIGRIVSCLNLISQTWTFAGIPFGVGRIELVGTAPEYRRQGLIRAQFDVVHRWSAARGELVQAITGIPFYYRQFGYEMALDLGGGRVCYPHSVPNLKPGQKEPFALRAVDENDLDFAMAMDAVMAGKSLIHALRDRHFWRYELSGRPAGSAYRGEWRIIQTPEGERAGLIGFSPTPWGPNRLGIWWLELAPGYSYVEASASILRGLRAEAETILFSKGRRLGDLYFQLGESHPLYEANHDRLAFVRPAYAWYLRVPDLPGFVRTIAPALQQRLEHTHAAGHTGELKLNFYRSGLRLALERGRLSAIEGWTPSLAEEGDAAFPGLTFLQLLFGYRTLDQLGDAFPDIWTKNDEARGLLTALFPRLRSRFSPIG